jgi:hypothetical protein
MGAEVDLFYRKDLPLRFVINFWESLLLLITNSLIASTGSCLSNTLLFLHSGYHHVLLFLHMGNLLSILVVNTTRLYNLSSVHIVH